MKRIVFMVTLALVMAAMMVAMAMPALARPPAETPPLNKALNMLIRSAPSQE